VVVDVAVDVDVVVVVDVLVLVLVLTDGEAPATATAAHTNTLDFKRSPHPRSVAPSRAMMKTPSPQENPHERSR